MQIRSAKDELYENYQPCFFYSGNAYELTLPLHTTVYEATLLSVLHTGGMESMFDEESRLGVGGPHE